MRLLTALGAGCLLFASGGATAARFSEVATMQSRIISASPLQVELTLAATTPLLPADFAAVGLDGTATMVVAHGRDSVLLYAPAVVVNGRDYAWTFGRHTAGAGGMAAVVGEGTDGHIDYPFLAGAAGAHMQTRLVIEFREGVAFDPATLHVQTVYFTPPHAPPIDVFRHP
jgi:hypothetical protein